MERIPDFHCKRQKKTIYITLHITDIVDIKREFNNFIESDDSCKLATKYLMNISHILNAYAILLMQQFDEFEFELIPSH